MKTRHPVRHLALATSAVVLTTSCGSTPDAASGDRAAATQQATSPTSSPPAATSDVEGTWRAGPFALRDVTQHLQQEGLDRWADAFAEGRPPTTELVYDLKLQGGGLLLSVTIDGETQGVWDRQSYTAEDRRITFSTGTCSSELGWRVAGDELTFRLLRDACPDYQGTPDKVYLQALYASVPYTRMS